jgi:hypothetical protein
MSKLLLLQFLRHPQVFKVLLIIVDLVLIDSVDLMEIKFESIAQTLEGYVAREVFEDHGLAIGHEIV